MHQYSKLPMKEKLNKARGYQMERLDQRRLSVENEVRLKNVGLRSLQAKTEKNVIIVIVIQLNI